MKFGIFLENCEQFFKSLICFEEEKTKKGNGKEKNEKRVPRSHMGRLKRAREGEWGVRLRDSHRSTR